MKRFVLLSNWFDGSRLKLGAPNLAKSVAMMKRSVQKLSKLGRLVLLVFELTLFTEIPL